MCILRRYDCFTVFLSSSEKDDYVGKITETMQSISMITGIHPRNETVRQARATTPRPVWWQLIIQLNLVILGNWKLWGVCLRLGMIRQLVPMLNFHATLFSPKCHAVIQTIIKTGPFVCLHVRQHLWLHCLSSVSRCLATSEWPGYYCFFVFGCARW